MSTQTVKQKVEALKVKLETVKSFRPIYTDFSMKTIPQFSKSIQTTKSVEEVKKMFVYLKSQFEVKKENTSELDIELGIKDDTETKTIDSFMGNSYEQILSDCKNRIQDLSKDETIKKIEKLIVKYEGFLTKEDFLEDLDNEMESLLK